MEDIVSRDLLLELLCCKGTTGLIRVELSKGKGRRDCEEEVVV